MRGMSKACVLFVGLLSACGEPVLVADLVGRAAPIVCDYWERCDPDWYAQTAGRCEEQAANWLCEGLFSVGVRCLDEVPVSQDVDAIAAACSAQMAELACGENGLRWITACVAGR